MRAGTYAHTRARSLIQSCEGVSGYRAWPGVQFPSDPFPLAEYNILTSYTRLTWKQSSLTQELNDG